MARLPDKTYISYVTIPGSHDASTGSGWADGYAAIGENYARTQDLTIGEQWTQGVRAFDLRPCSYEDHLNLNHGIVPTVLHFDEVLCQLRDSLKANPSEFVIIHIRHESEGDRVENVYDEQIKELFKRDDLKDYLVNFKVALRVSDMRGKILILSRNTYGTTPIGGFIQNWTSDANWDRQTQGKIVGPKNASAPLYMQDYYETYASGAMQTKIDAITKMLDYSTTHRSLLVSQVVWVLNFASAYSKVEKLLGDIATSDGYRDNAAHTHEAILDYLSTHSGWAGVVMMDYAGVDESNGYKVRGQELVKALIEQNFTYLQDESDVSAVRAETPAEVYSVQGIHLPTPRRGTVNIIRQDDGTVRKVLMK